MEEISDLCAEREQSLQKAKDKLGLTVLDWFCINCDGHGNYGHPEEPCLRYKPTNKNYN